MKKLKLITATFALLLGWSNAIATDWVGSEPANGEFYLYNVGTDKYLAFGATWGTQATVSHAGIPVTLEVNGTGFNIVTNVVENGKALKADGYVDGNKTAWTFTLVDNEKKIYNIHIGDDKYLFYNTAETQDRLGVGANTNNTYSQWQLVTTAQRDAAFTAKNASEDKPLDITYKYIQNPNTTYFTNIYSSTNSFTKGGDKGWDIKGANNDWWDGKDNNAEVWNGTYDNYIEITEIPNGVYEFGVMGFYRDGDGTTAIDHYAAGTFADNAKIYANTNETSLQSIVVGYNGSAIENGKDVSKEVSGTTYYIPDSQVGAALYFIRDKYNWQTVRTVVTNNTLRIGVKKTVAVGSDWTIVDKFYLSYLGVDLDALKDAMDARIVAAEAIDQSKLPTGIKTRLATVISTYKGQSYSTEDEYNTATTNINDAIENANASIPLFADFNTLKGQADALVAVANTNAEANSTLSTAISTQNTAVVEATTADAISTAISTLKTAMITYAGAADPTSGNRFDLTFMMTNPSLDAFAAWTKNIPGWDSEETDGNYQAMVNDSKTVGDKDHFYEYWSDRAKASGKFALYNAVTLPAGTYSMSCYAFAENQHAAETVNGVFFYANDTQGSAVTSTVLSEQSISFINESEQEVKIGLKTQTGNTRNWMGIGYVKLYKEYTDNNTYTITTNINGGDVSVTVDGEPATSAKALKTVTLTVSNYTEGYAVGNVTATYNDGEVKNLDVANPSENVYTYQQPAYNVTVTINVVVDKRTLNTAIAEATAARKSANEGTGVFQIPAAAGSALADAISTAQVVYDDAEATVSQVADAVTAINTAKTTYEGATFNAPDASKRYVLTIVEDGKAWDGNAVTFIEGARTDMGGYGIKYLAPANANLNQALKFTAVDGETNTYKVSAINVADGGERYITTGSTYDGGNNTQIRTTDDASKASWIKIQATSTDGQFKLLNVSDGNKVIANNNNNDMYTANTCNFTIAEAAQASVNVTIAADVKFATRIFPFKPALPAGIKAYSIESAADGVITLAEVADPAANTPYILFAEAGYTGDALTGFGTAGATTYTANDMTGVYEATASQEGWYVLQNNGGKVGFYQVGAEVKPTIAANRCYFTGPSSARAFIFDMETTAINAINALTTGETEIYDLNGVKQNRLQKGMNIVNKNGKTFKVMVK